MNKTVEELKMVRAVLRKAKIALLGVGGVDGPLDCADSITKLTTIIEQMEKAEPVGWRVAHAFVRGDFTAGKPHKETIDYWREQGVALEYAYTHAAPTPDEITKLREQLAAVDNENKQLWKNCASLSNQLAATQAEVEALRGVMQQARDALEQSADALAYAAFNIDGSKLEDLQPGLIESTSSAETALLAERCARAAIAAIDAAMQPASDEAGKGE